MLCTTRQTCVPPVEKHCPVTSSCHNSRTHQPHSPATSWLFLDVGSTKKKQLHPHSNLQWWKPQSACNPILDNLIFLTLYYTLWTTPDPCRQGETVWEQKSYTPLNLMVQRYNTELYIAFSTIYSWGHFRNCSQVRHFDIFFCVLHKVTQDHSICKLNWSLRKWLLSKTD
jgi:hypothetical protein